jgi:hypothetical protein
MNLVIKKKGRPKNPPNIAEIVATLLPASDMFNEEEYKLFQGLMDFYMRDFDESQLTSNDLDDIISIATNRVLELRLLKSSKDNTDEHLAVSTSIERIRKQTDKLKENLASRRKDRVDPKKFTGLSIIDLAAAFDEGRKKEKFEKALQLRKEEGDVLKSDVLIGNSQDPDVEILEEED